MELSAVVVSYNSASFLPGCLNSLLRQQVPCREIIVVDNHSQDGSSRLLDGFPTVIPIRLTKNNGYARAANLGLRQASAGLILVANPDTIFPADFSRQVLDTFRRDPSIGLLAPLLLRFDRATIDSAGQTRSLALHPREIGFNQRRDRMDLRPGTVFSACGAATVFSRPALEKLKIGRGEFYDEDFFMFWEDFDIGWRAQLLGVKTFFTPQVTACHFRSATLKRTWLARFSLALARSPELKYHLVKNRYLTLIKNFRLGQFWWAIPFMLARDLVWVGALTISSPKIIIRLMGASALIRRALGKRKRLKQHE